MSFNEKLVSLCRAFLASSKSTLAANLNHSRDISPSLSSALSDRWQELCALYLPVVTKDSIWRYSRAGTLDDPAQGWKLHISATVLTATSVLAAVGPLLQNCGTLFKGPASLQELDKLNCGLYYGYTQVGKCLTVYPTTTEAAVCLAEQLHQLTAGLAAPAVPFDLRFKPESCVHYRYGAFKHQEIKNEDGTCLLALRNPEGQLVPDVRESLTARPAWVSDLFVIQPPQSNDPTTQSPLTTTFKAFRALAQRGKGGVYQALDLSAQPPRLCILKEGRGGGEPDWEGRDGHWRVRNEGKVLGALRALGIAVPCVYASFEVEGNFYLVTEFIEGVSLQTLLNQRQRRLPIRRVLQYGLQLSQLLSQMHAAGWVWRDCKPSNLIVTKDGALRALDFEGACLLNQPNPLPWGTYNYVPPELDKGRHGQSSVTLDLYALGVVLYHLLSGRFPSLPAPTPVEKLRRSVPVAVRRIIAALLGQDPQQRPSAQRVARKLKAVLLAGNAPSD